MKAKFLPIFIVFCLSSFLYAETTADSPNESVADADIAYIIQDVRFDIKGITLEHVLRRKAAIYIGSRFASEDELISFLAERRQVLLNERVLETVEVSYEISSTDNAYDIVVIFTVEDTWNLIALPYPRYDTNTGLLLSIRGRDYNFLGSMQALRLDLDYRVTEKGKVGYGTSISFDYPIVMGELYSNISINQELNIYPDQSPIRNISSLSYSVSYAGWGFPLSASVSQSIATNPDGVSFDVDPYFLSTGFGLNSAIALSPNLLGLGELFYYPSANINLAWKPDGPVREDRRGYIITLAQRFGWGRADWIGNMKRGLEASLSNSNTFFQRDGSWIADADLSLSAFLPAGEYFSTKIRLEAFKRLTGGPRTGMGGNLRGIVNNRVSGDAGITLNVDFPVKLFDFPTHAIIKYDWLDFELQASPFIETAYYLPTAGSSLNAGATWASGGLEFLVFPKRMRSFIVRASVGVDLRHVLSGKMLDEATYDDYSPFELFFGVGLHY